MTSQKSHPQVLTISLFDRRTIARGLPPDCFGRYFGDSLHHSSPHQRQHHRSPPRRTIIGAPSRDGAGGAWIPQRPVDLSPGTPE